MHFLQQQSKVALIDDALFSHILPQLSPNFYFRQSSSSTVASHLPADAQPNADVASPIAPRAVSPARICSEKNRQFFSRVCVYLVPTMHARVESVRAPPTPHVLVIGLDNQILRRVASSFRCTRVVSCCVVSVHCLQRSHAFLAAAVQGRAAQSLSLYFTEQKTGFNSHPRAP